MCVFSVSPVLVILIESFTAGNYISFPPDSFSIKWYKEFLKRDEFIESVYVSLYVALMASVTSTFIGLLASVAMFRYSFFGKKIINLLFMAPLSLPGLILGLSLLQFLAINSIPRNIFTLSLTHIVICIPFAIRFIMVSLTGVDPKIEQAAQSLGANRFYSFWFITFPLLRPGITASFVFSFIISFDEVAASIFVSSTNAMTLPVRIYAYIDQNYDPLVTAVSSLLIFGAAIALVIIEKTVGMGKLFGMK